MIERVGNKDTRRLSTTGRPSHATVMSSSEHASEASIDSDGVRLSEAPHSFERRTSGESSRGDTVSTRGSWTERGEADAFVGGSILPHEVV